MKLPYGNADFHRIVKEGFAYIDRTAAIRDFEEIGDALLFLRPRRFGKTLWIRTLATYYDRRFRDEHEEIFGRLAIGREPTAGAHNYFVLHWNFSELEPHGTVEDLARELNAYVNSTLRIFLREYRDHLPEPVTIRPEATNTLRELLAVIRQTPHRLYLLVDEYDNFANEVMMTDASTYEGLVKKDGPFKTLMKSVKSAKEGQGLERLFFTGVSPIVMSDLTSGMNIAKDVSRHPRLHDLCGFHESDLRGLLSELLEELGTPEAIEEAAEMMRVWYNGYRFSTGVAEKIYNPTLVLYFLDHLQDYGHYPRQMLDANLAMDQGKLTYLAREIPGQQAVMDILQTGEPVEVNEILAGFSLAEMISPEGHHRTYVGSFLYYFGMLTLKGGWTSRGTLELIPPNLVTQKLYIDHLRRLLLTGETDPNAPEDPPLALATQGDIEPLASYVERHVFRRFSNLDYRWMNELAVKTAFLALAFNDRSYMLFSEPELDRDRADLCLLRRPDTRTDALWDLLLEFKYVRLKQLRLSGKQLRDRSREELLAMKPVKEAFAEAGKQLDAYRRFLEDQMGPALRLRSYAVVALGFERLLTREL